MHTGLHGLESYEEPRFGIIYQESPYSKKNKLGHTVRESGNKYPINPFFPLICSIYQLRHSDSPHHGN